MEKSFQSKVWGNVSFSHIHLTSTESQFFAAQFTGTGPIQAKHAGIKKALQRVNAHEGWAD